MVGKERSNVDWSIVLVSDCTKYHALREHIPEHGFLLLDIVPGYPDFSAEPTLISYKNTLNVYSDLKWTGLQRIEKWKQIWSMKTCLSWRLI